MTGTVQTTVVPQLVPLTEGQTWEFAVALMQQAPRDLDPDKVRYYLANKKELGADLRAVLGQPLQAFDTRPWQKFFKKYFSRTVDLSNLHIPTKLDYLCRAVVIVPELTNNDIFDACTKAFNGTTWRYANDLNTVRDIVVRPQGPHVIWFRDVVEADADMANKSARDIATAGTNTTTLKERMLLELVYFDETGGHLDIQNWTLCAGSRIHGGSVPRCRWNVGKFFVSATVVVNCYPGLRARVVVS
ncbi:MAG: hypothetical protein Q7S26_02640 [bacterium]|nr:hypothetical protein [bacterium]